MTFSYSANLPNPPNDPADDVAGMQTNTASISSIVAVDHVGFNVAGGGQHKQVTFNANNVPVPPVSLPVLFTNTVDGLPQLFFYSGDAAHSSTQYVKAGNGSTFLLGGIIIKWGTYTIPGGFTTQAVSFANDFPNNFFSLTITPQTVGSNADYNFRYTTTSTAGFTGVRVGVSGAATYSYIAIGN